MALPSRSSLAIVLSLLLLTADGQTPSTPIVTSITKDRSTSLYTIPVKNGAPLVLDLAGSLVWSTCQQGHHTIPCKSSVCKVANRNHPAGCASTNGGQSGSTDPHCTCSAYPYNPVSGHCGNGDLTVLPLSAQATDGEHPLSPVSLNAYGSCAPDGLLESLPSGAAGVAGLSRLPLSLPSQVASKLKVAKQFALCLPSDGNTGAAVFGGGPFFRVHGIAVNQELVPIAPGALDLNTHTGRGGVVFSSVTPYTTLRDDIFGPLLTAFEKVTSGARVVKPPPPHFRCFDASSFGSTRLGPAVPNIDLILDNGQNWTLPGASSLVQVGEGTLCFAFDNMGWPASDASDAPAIILGTHQMQDNLVQFDLEKNTFGFSGLLLGRSTHCGNFNSGKR
ncbi:hypothetical protein EJB05_37765, partial [Eragrostis curvula]